MTEYQKDLQQEVLYLNKIIACIKKELENESDNLARQRSKLIASRKDMSENTAPFTDDFDKATEMNQYLSVVKDQTANYLITSKQVEKYKKMLPSPYFGRFDFVEVDCEREKIYVGLSTLMDADSQQIYVYDWRAPVSSIYYRYELGKASYTAPVGLILGDVILKRQYKIKESSLKYFFDCSIIINDGILQEVLGSNSSPNMRTIVETIQKEQDIIIRDIENELLVVQGVAGSGKTSIALHRVACLLYTGLNSNLSSNNVIIISPNTLFSKYISGVLPELGEENVEQTTFDNIVSTTLEGQFIAETRAVQLESITISHKTMEGKARLQSIEFKGSRTFKQILDRLIHYYERRMIPFEDIYYNGTILETRETLKNRFLNNKTGIPMTKQLQRLESLIWEKIHPLRKKRLEKIEKVVDKTDGHELEVRSFSRLLSIKETRKIKKRLKKFTTVDYFNLYSLLFQQKGLLNKLSQGLPLPDSVEQIITITRDSLNNRQLLYEDCSPLVYLKLIIEGIDLFPEIKQVVVDEAQDYYPMQYEVFKLLFKDAKYTVLGDINQTVEKTSDCSLYDELTKILNKPKTTRLFLNKSYRSSYQITKFCQNLLSVKQDIISFERHEEEPLIVYKETEDLLNNAIISDIAHFQGQGFETIAIICKSLSESEKLHSKLKNRIDVTLVQPQDSNVVKGIMIIPSYMAKGLEFDVVLVYDVNTESYSSYYDRRLLYIACTRAQHRLMLYYTGGKSKFL